MSQTAQAKPQDYLFKGKLNQLGVYSVILTELGISVFNGDKHEKSFPFSDMVKEYVAIKKKQADIENSLHLAPIQRGIKQVTSCFCLLKKESMTQKNMEAKEIRKKMRDFKHKAADNCGFYLQKHPRSTRKASRLFMGFVCKISEVRQVQTCT